MTVDHVAILYFLRHGIKLEIFLITHLNCILEGASFKLIENLATLIPENLQVCYGPLLYHCYTLQQKKEDGTERFNSQKKLVIFTCLPTVLKRLRLAAAADRAFVILPVKERKTSRNAGPKNNSARPKIRHFLGFK